MLARNCNSTRLLCDECEKAKSLRKGAGCAKDIAEGEFAATRYGSLVRSGHLTRLICNECEKARSLRKCARCDKDKKSNSLHLDKNGHKFHLTRKNSKKKGENEFHVFVSAAGCDGVIKIFANKHI